MLVCILYTLAYPTKETAAPNTTSAVMSVLRLKIKGWEDGEPVEKWLEKPDRWQLHSADQVTLAIDDMEVTINQRVSFV